MSLLKTMLVALSLGTALLCGSAQAALENVDWKTPGDSAISKDTATNLGWLDLSITKGLSVNQVLAQLGAGGQFAGFRLPTADELFALMTNLSRLDMYTTPGVTKSVSVPIDFTQMDTYGFLSNRHVPMLGQTYRVSTMVSSRGLYLNTLGNLETAYIMQRTTTGGDINYVMSGTTYTYSVGQAAAQNSMDYTVFSHGVWLVKDLQPALADVSTPLSGIAMAGLLLLMRRRVR